MTVAMRKEMIFFITGVWYLAKENVRFWFGKVKINHFSIQ
jgi:hypothetical protein